MSEPEEQMASEEQLQELRSLAGDEDIPDGMRASEAAQRIVELRSAE
ncbi:MAG: hypothetical protein ABJA87_09695 [bacterium]